MSFGVTIFHRKILLLFNQRTSLNKNSMKIYRMQQEEKLVY